MSTANDPLVITEDPPPAYHDGRAIERLPSYREGHLRRHHPYGRYTPSLLQRLLLSPYAYDFDYAPIPATGLDAGLRDGVQDAVAASTAVTVGESSSTPLPTSSSSARARPDENGNASRNVSSLSLSTNSPTTSTSRPAKRKRDEFEGQDDCE